MVQRESRSETADRSDPRFSQSLERGLAILTCFSAGDSTLGIADIAEKVGLSRSTTHRYAVTLLELGYLEQDGERKYRLGPRVTDLGVAAVAATGLVEQAGAFLQQLRKGTTLTVNLAVLDGEEVVYLQRLRGIGVGAHECDLDTGSRYPAHCTAAGKLLLAYLPKAEQKRALAATDMKTRPRGAASSKTGLRSQLESISKRGLACEDEQRAAEVHEVAVPVLSGAEVIAALSVIACGGKLTAEQIASSHLPAMRRTADSISLALGASQNGKSATAAVKAAGVSAV